MTKHLFLNALLPNNFKDLWQTPEGNLPKPRNVCCATTVSRSKPPLDIYD